MGAGIDHSSVVVNRNGAELLESTISNKTAKIGIVGLGYVGLPLAVEYASAGYRTIGFDVNDQRVRDLNNGINHIQDIDNELFSSVLGSGNFSATTNFSLSAEIDVFFICVPTPVHDHKNPDDSLIRSAIKSLSPQLRKGQLYILKSTVYPGATESLIVTELERVAKSEALELGKDYFVAFSPERIDPGNSSFNTSNTPVVVGGVSSACLDLASLALKVIVDHVHPVSSPRVAEMEKLLENIFRSVNIAFVNEMARLCDRVGGISIWEVIEAASTKPFGYMPFFPGPGLGGHCIPVDPYYLSWFARKYDFETSFITLSARINEDMPFYVLEAIISRVAQLSKPLSDVCISILGVSFKKDVDDLRHSPAVRVIELLLEKGITHIHYSDPYVSAVKIQKNELNVELTSENITDGSIERADIMVLLTDHSDFDYDDIASKAKTIIDTRNAFKNVSEHLRNKIYLIGGGG